MRAWALTLNIVASLLVLSPAVAAVADRTWDSFPLSWYPMFSEPRDGIERPRYVMGVTDAGERHLIPFTYWSSGGFNQGSMQLKNLHRAKEGGLRRLCRQVARRIVSRDQKRLADVTKVLVLRGNYAPIPYFRDGETEPLREQVLARCPVEGR